MSGIGPLVQTAGTSLTIDESGQSWQSSSWWQQLQPGSWRGVGFVMDAGETKAGRRVALHEYPYRDTVWPEDLGKLPRRFAFQGWLTGDDVYQQRDAMIAACEQPGPGTLVHPTQGAMQCVLLDFSTTDRRERGRYVEVQFEFIVASDILFPATAIATGQQVQQLAGRLGAASTADLDRQLGTLPGIPQLATRQIAAYGFLATGAVDDPTRALGAVRGLPGVYGRYAGGSRATLLPSTWGVTDALAASVVQRTAVYAAVASLQAAAGGL